MADLEKRLQILEGVVNELRSRRRPASQLVHAVVPASITKTKGTTASALSTVQTFDDGNVMDITEETGSPGIHTEFGFTAVTKIRQVLAHYYYAGSSSHNLWIQIWNYSTSAWTNLYGETGAVANALRVINISIPFDVNYISSGAAALRLYHAESGTGSHHLYIDYVALIY